MAINVHELLEMIYKANTLYDKEKYKEMILDAAETVLGHFGFDRTSYGNKKMISKRKWWWMEELGQERERDIRTEVV